MKQFFLYIFLLLSSSVYGQEAFITTWKTDEPGFSKDHQISIPTIGSGYNYNIDWGDGTIDENVTGTILHSFTSPGTYIVTITGDFPRIYFFDLSGNQKDNQKILTIEQWGNISWTSMNYAFHRCTNLRIPATDAPDLSNVSDLSFMFEGATAFNDPIDHWDVSQIMDMTGMFQNATSFNEAIGSWNVNRVKQMTSMFENAASFNREIHNWQVDNVTDMRSMFFNARSFNRRIGDWKVDKVVNMSGMFSQTNSFNQDLSDWNVSKVVSMNDMFRLARAFNGDIVDWNVSSVTQMGEMFAFNSVFNQDISRWNVSKVENMDRMFFNTRSFNQDLSDWDIQRVKEMNNMLSNTNLTTKNYDKLLIGWAERSSLQTGISLAVKGSHYCIGQAARQKLIDDYDWTIGDEGILCTLNLEEKIFSIVENSPSGTIVDTLRIDLGPDVPASYYITEGNVGEVFSIDVNSGMLSIANPEYLDFETHPTFTLDIELHGTQIELNIITVQVTNINEAPVTTDIEFSIQESISTDRILGTISATDPDNHRMTYSIIEGNEEGVFVVNPETGDIRISDLSIIDFEKTLKKSLTVEVFDGSLSAFSNVYICFEELVTNVEKTILEPVTVFPNPATDKIEVRLRSGIYNPKVKLVDINGKDTGISFGSTNSIFVADITRLVKGYYLILIETEEQQLTRLVLKE